MNKSKKNNKNFIIIGVALVIVVIFIIALILPSKETDENSKIVCEIENKSFYANLKTTHVVYYNNDQFEKLELEITMELTEQLMIDKIDLLKEKYEEKFAKMNELESFDYEITKDGNTLIIKNSVNAKDYKRMVELNKVTEGEIESTSINFYDDSKKFINDIILQGGTCNYE